MTATDKNKTAFTFPGVGIELSGSEPAFYERYKSIYAPFFEKGSEWAKTDLTKSLTSSSIDKLDEWQSQIFIYCFSVGTFHVLKENRITPDITAGYSFGIYAALYASGVISFSDGFDILKRAYSAIDESRPKQEVGVCATVGLSLEEVSGIIENSGFQTIQRINTNNEFCHLLCGNREEINPFQDKASAADAISVSTLNISHPYHHPLFSEKAKTSLRDFIDTLQWNTPECSLLSTIDQTLLTTADTLKQFTADHLATPINWHKTVELLYSKVYSRLIECGPGVSLTQNARFISGKAQWINTRNIQNRLGI